VFRNILVAIDGSAHASRALAEATFLAERSNATMTIMTAVPDPSTWLVAGPAYLGGIDFERLEEAEREYTKLLNDAVAELPQDLSARRFWLAGSPPSASSSNLRRATMTSW
jgi:nucleotide-binding universal stress UspA family protein